MIGLSPECQRNRENSNNPLKERVAASPQLVVIRALLISKQGEVKMGKRTLFEEKPLRNFFCGRPIGKPTFHPNDNWPTDNWSLTTGINPTNGLQACVYKLVNTSVF